jgi:hypothetical protein
VCITKNILKKDILFVVVLVVAVVGPFPCNMATIARLLAVYKSTFRLNATFLSIVSVFAPI